jgi:hypothetical protein
MFIVLWYSILMLTLMELVEVFQAVLQLHWFPYNLEHCALETHYIAPWHKNNRRIIAEIKGNQHTDYFQRILPSHLIHY